MAAGMGKRPRPIPIHRGCAAEDQLVNPGWLSPRNKGQRSFDSFVRYISGKEYEVIYGQSHNPLDTIQLHLYTTVYGYKMDLGAILFK